MKLFNDKDDALYLTKSQWRKIFLAMSIMTLLLYTVAMIFSLCGSQYFILNYQNAQMDRIESFTKDSVILSNLLDSVFFTIEFAIILSFMLKKFPKWYYLLAFLILPLIPHFIFGRLPDIYYSLMPFIFYLIIPIIEQLKEDRKVCFKKYAFCLLRLCIAMVVVFILQVMIYIIKSGSLSFDKVVLNLSATIIYMLEYDIALAVILFTILLVYREKGDSKKWATIQPVGSSSLTSKKQSLKSKQMNLSKTQKNKIRLLYAKFYITQLGAFLLLMVLPFILGKVFEFLVMYLAFAVARYLLGFKYSLHYKKESLCIIVGAIVFGILSLAVPFFYVVLIIAITLGVALAVLLHLSYKYKGMFLFAQISRPDKFAELYVIFDGDLDRHHVQIMCLHKGLDKETTSIVCDFTDGNKKSYIAKKYNYSEKTIERKINDAVDILKKNS